MGVRFDSPARKTAQNEDRVDVLFTRKINWSEYIDWVGWEGEIIRQNYSDMLSQQVLTWSNFLLSLLLSHASSTSFSTPLEIHKVIAGVHLHEIYASGNSFCEARVNMGVQVYFRAFAGYMHRPTESTSTRHTSEVTSVKLAGIRKKVSKTVRGISSTMWCSWSCSKISHDRIASRACPIMYYFFSLVALCAHCDFCLAFKRT